MATRYRDRRGRPAAFTSASCSKAGWPVKKLLYGPNTAGKWVRRSDFREIDYDPKKLGILHEFGNFEDIFAFDE